MNLLQENPQLFEKELTTKSLVNEIVPSIFELFERRNQLIVDSEGYPRISNSIIVATPKNMWVIGTTGEVSETDFAAIGAFVEATAAHAALKLTGYHSKDAALLTVAAVSNTDNTVGYPLYILKTNSDITETYWSESAVVKSIEVRSWKN